MKKNGPGRVVVITEWVSRKTKPGDEVEDAAPAEVRVSRELPAEESWLYEKSDAVEMVARGLRQASLGVFADYPPDLESDRLLVARIGQ